MWEGERENLEAIFGRMWRKKLGMQIRQPQSMPEVISATLWGAVSLVGLVWIGGWEEIYVQSATGKR